ncbi:MAG: VWA domain-containing protein [Bryobacterales bacterium]|nr:VWA domain-containing protein [Bryobacterales bacterium]
MNRLAFFLALVVALVLAGQESHFDARARLVLVPVTVTDGKGRNVDGLEASDFLVLDNGHPRRLLVDSTATGVAPIALMIAVQASGISSAALEKVRKIGAMVQPLITGERGCAGLLSFAGRVAWLEDCTNDPGRLAASFGRLEAGEERTARMLDAVYEAIRRLRAMPNRRRVLLLISESRDRGSETNLDAVVAAGQAAGVTIYAATYSAFKTAFTTKSSAKGRPAPRKNPGPPTEPAGTIDGGPPSQINPRLPPPEQRVDLLAGIGELSRLNMPNSAKVLSEATGGTIFPFTRQRGLEGVMEKLGAELHAQYVLSFSPEGAEPGYHRLEVRLPRRPDARIRSRPGYRSTQ